MDTDKVQWKKLIKAEIDKREIKYLTHFTRIKNLPNILRSGLIPRAYLQWNEFYPTDIKRLDNNLNGNCLSITRVNEEMLKYKIKQFGYKFAILIYDVKKVLLGDYLSALPRFYYTNSASNEIRSNRRIYELGGSYSGVEAFRFMFKKEFDISLSSKTGQVKRCDGAPLNYTTDIQAETVIYDTIPPDYIQKIIFYKRDEEAINAFCEALAKNEIWRLKQKAYYYDEQPLDINSRLKKIKSRSDSIERNDGR